MHNAGSYQYGLAVESYLNGTLLSRQILDYNLNVSLSTSTEQILEEQIIFYPNPVSDILYSDYQGDNHHYEILTPEGQVVLSGQDFDQVDMSSLASGVYLLLITKDGHVISSEKIVKL